MFTLKRANSGGVGKGRFEFDVGALRQFALDAELAHPNYYIQLISMHHRQSSQISIII